MINFLIGLLEKVHLTKKEKKKLEDYFVKGLDQAYLRYQALSQEERDMKFVEVAQSMGCSSNDVENCKKYIYMTARCSPQGTTLH